MNDIRARFEEIWPVPEGIEWLDDQYVTVKGTPKLTMELIDKCIEWDARLDTFTRCQETTDVYVSLIDELVGQLSDAKAWVKWEEQLDTIQAALYRAKQVMELKK